jgi:hypothetical protein
MVIRERAPEPNDNGRENRLKANPNDDNQRIAWTEHRAGDGKSIPIPKPPNAEEMGKLVECGTPESPDRIDENEIEEMYWKQGIRIGIFHETEGPRMHDPQAEEVRRWLSSRIATEEKKEIEKLRETLDGHTFWRFKSWILIADKYRERAEGAERNFYASARIMEREDNLHPTEDLLQEVQAWVGLALLDKFMDVEMNEADTEEHHRKPMREHVEEEFALEAGCTFKLRFTTPNLTQEMEHAKKMRQMKEGARIYISTLGKPMVPTKEGIRIDLTFGEEEEGGYHMTRGGDNRGNVTLEELTSKLFECKKRGGILINFKERMGTWYKLGTRALETTLERIIKRIERLAHEKKWANIDQPESILGGIESNIDQTFDSDHCLISGLLPKYLNNGR